jgi:hypothetical protein
MQEILVILNPAARSERAKKTWKQIESFPHCTLRTTTATGDARAFAEQAVGEGFTTIVAAGGDGTVNEVVNGIAGSGVALGILCLQVRTVAIRVTCAEARPDRTACAHACACYVRGMCEVYSWYVCGMCELVRALSCVRRRVRRRTAHAHAPAQAAASSSS